MLMKRRIACLTAALLLLGHGPRGAAQGVRPFTIADYFGVKWITSAQISADGARVLYTVDELDVAADAQRQSVWVVDARGGAPFRLAEAVQPSSAPPAWSPDCRRVAFTFSREAGEQLWLVGVSGGEAVRLTSAPSGVRAFAWSPDGAAIAFVATEAGDATALKQAAETNVPHVPQLHLLNVGTKEVRQLTRGADAPGDFSWSPDGKQIAFTARDDIYVVAVESGQTRKLVERPGRDVNPRWSPDGTHVAFFSNYGNASGPGWLSVVAAGGGAPRDAYSSFDPGFGGYPPWFHGWSADGKTLYSAGLSRMTQHLYALPAGGGAATRVTSGEMVYHDFSLSADGRTMAFLASSSGAPEEVYVSPVNTFRPKRLTTTNPQLEGVSFGETEAVRWRSQDGLEVEGLLLKPAGYERGRRYPLLVLMEGTFGSFDFSFTGRVSADSVRGFSFPFQQQIFAGRGYAVLMPNPRGSWGYGADFGKRVLGDFGTGPYQDIIAGVEHLVARGVADPDRLGIMGIYVDAYRAVFAVTQTDRFKAAVVGAPVFNLVSWYGQLGPEAAYADRYFGGAPWQVPQNYERINPVNFAGKIKTPTLVFNVTLPDFPPLMQARELQTALKRNGVPTDSVNYPPRGFAVGPKSLADVLRRNNEWFGRWVRKAGP